MIEREQFYLDRFQFIYNNLNKVVFLLDFKHSDLTKQLIGKTNKNAVRSDKTRLKIATTLSKSITIFVKNNDTGEIEIFSRV